MKLLLTIEIGWPSRWVVFVEGDFQSLQNRLWDLLSPQLSRNKTQSRVELIVARVMPKYFLKSYIVSLKFVSYYYYYYTTTKSWNLIVNLIL